MYEHLDHLKITKNRSEFKDREKLLDSFIKNNYLKRTQTTDYENDELVYIYTWGPRATVELGHSGVVEFLSSVSLDIDVHVFVTHRYLLVL